MAIYKYLKIELSLFPANLETRQVYVQIGGVFDRLAQTIAMQSDCIIHTNVCIIHTEADILSQEVIFLNNFSSYLIIDALLQERIFRNAIPKKKKGLFEIYVFSIRIFLK